MLNFTNFKLVTDYLLPSLLASTLWSGVIAIAIGSVIGLIIGAIKRRIRKTITPAILGCFFGVMLGCMVPLYSIPGLVQSWGLGGGLGSLPVLFMVVALAPLGGIIGAVIGSTSGLKFFQKPTGKRPLMLLAATYGIMFFSIYLSFVLVCSTPTKLQWYCTDLGF